MQNKLKKIISILLCGILSIGCIACSQTKSETTDLLGKAIENYKDASSYKSKLIITMNNDTQKYPMIPSGDSVHYVEYIKEPFQMLFNADVIDHHIYSLISQNKDKIKCQTRVDDKTVTREVSATAIEVNKAFYCFVIDLISQNKKNFKEEENSDSISGKTLFKGEILPEQAENLYQHLQSVYGTSSENEIPNLGLYINTYEDISSGSQPLPTVVTIDNKTNQIIKIEVDTTNALKEAELKSNFLEINQENMKNTILLESALTQEFSDYNHVKSIQIP
ncbi:MAG: hypothetical protein AAGU75_03510 [Bacillota bacterium]